MTSTNLSALPARQAWISWDREGAWISGECHWDPRTTGHHSNKSNLRDLGSSHVFCAAGGPRIGFSLAHRKVWRARWMTFAAPNSNYKSCEHRLAACSVVRRLESLLESRLFGRQWIWGRFSMQSWCSMRRGLLRRGSLRSLWGWFSNQNCSCTPRKWHFEVSSYFSVGLGTARSRVASKHPNGISESVAILAASTP